MILLNNAPNIEVGATNENYLKTVEYKEPALTKVILQQYGALGMYPLVEMVLGGGKIYEPNLNKRENFNQIGADQLSWPVMPNQTNTTFLRGAFAATWVGQTSDNVARTLSLQDGWLQAGYELLIPNVNGQYQKFVLTTGGTLNAGLYDYSAKYINSDPTIAVSAGQYGYTASQTMVSVYGYISSQESTSGVLTPTQPADLYTNFTKEHRSRLEVSWSEAASKIWFKGDNGDMVWTTMKEHQWRMNNAQKMETSMWYETRTYQTVASNYYSVNTPAITNAAGETLKAGDGVFAQIESGNNTQFSLATYTQPINYAAAISQMQDALTSWGIVNGIADTVDLVYYTGTAGYNWFQNVFKQYQDLSGGGIALQVIETKEGKEIKLNTTAYNFGGYRIHLKKCITFDNPQIQANRIAVGSSVSYSSYQAVLMPASTNNGTPVIECYFKGGEGFEGGFVETVIPGLRDPRTADGKSTTSATGFNGFYMEFATEFMTNINDPKKVMWFEWIA